MAEFWNEEITAKSYGRLLSLKGELDFVLIGGWAVYLHTNAYKSKDIDIVVDYAQLAMLKGKYRLAKNEFLKKYEIKGADFDIDIYAPKFSRLAVPPEELLEDFVILDGVKVARAEALVLLKEQAYSDRKGTIKGKKDALDILLLLLHSDLEAGKLLALARRLGVSSLRSSLREILANASDKDLPYLKTGRAEFLRRKRRLLEELRK